METKKIWNIIFKVVMYALGLITGVTASAANLV